MNKLALIQALKDSSNLSKSEAERIVNLFFNEIGDALSNGDQVKSGGCVPFTLKNTGHTPAEIPKPLRS
jgi:nucleoid DNA-binding protein